MSITVSFPLTSINLHHVKAIRFKDLRVRSDFNTFDLVFVFANGTEQLFEVFSEDETEPPEIVIDPTVFPLTIKPACFKDAGEEAIGRELPEPPEPPASDPAALTDDDREIIRQYLIDHPSAADLPEQDRLKLATQAIDIDGLPY